MMHKIDKCRCRVQEETTRIIDDEEGTTNKTESQQPESKLCSQSSYEYCGA